MNRLTSARLLILFMVLISLVPVPGSAVTYTVNEAWNVNLNGEEVRAVDISEDMTHAVAGTDANKVYLYTTGGSEVWNKTLNASYPLDKVNGTIFIDNTHFLAFSNKTNYIIKTDGTFLLNVTNTSQNYPVVAAAATITGDILAYCTPEYLYVYNITTGVLEGAWEPHTAAADHWRGVAIKEDGSVVYGLSSGGAIEAYSVWQLSSYTSTLTGNVTYVDAMLTAPTEPSDMLAGYNANATIVNATIIQTGYSSIAWEAYIGYDPASSSPFTGPVPLWFETYDVTNHVMKVWFKLPGMVSGVAKRIYLYQNTSRTSRADISTGWATFPVFDDWQSPSAGAKPNSTAWNVSYRGAAATLKNVSVINGALELNLSSGVMYYPYSINSKRTFDGNFTLYINGTFSVAPNPAGLGPDIGSISVNNLSDNQTTPHIVGVSTITGLISTFPANNLYLNMFTGDPWLGGSADWFTGYAGASLKLMLTYNATDADWWDYAHVYPGSDHYDVAATLSHPPYRLALLGDASQTALFGGVYNLSLKPVWVAKKDINQVSESFTDFRGWAGPYNTGYWTYWPYYNYTVSQTGLANPFAMSLASSEDWFAVSTTSTWYAQHVTGGSTFDTQYSYVSASGAPTATTRISSGGSFGIEGRGSGIIDILRLDGTRVGTYTAGGTINSVDITDNGLWAVAGSTDENLYIFGKASSSSWTLQATETPGGEIKAVRARSGSTVFLAGGGGGVFAYYTIGEAATTGSTTFWVGKSGLPYGNIPIEIEDCGTAGTTCSALYTGVTDSFGSYSASLTFGHYYQITVNSGEKVVTVLSTSNLVQYSIVIETGLPVPLHYESWYNATNGTIYMLYDNNTPLDTVSFEITRLGDSTVVGTWAPASSELPYLRQYDINGDWQNTSYRVIVNADDGTHSAENTWVFNAVNTSSGATPSYILPGWLDSYVKMAIGFVLALIIGGVFSYYSGPVGALVTSISALGLLFLGLFPTNMTGAIMLCVIWSFLGLAGGGR